MPDFFVVKSGGIKYDSSDPTESLFEGFKSIGPWYNTANFTVEQIEKWVTKGWIIIIGDDKK